MAVRRSVFTVAVVLIAALAFAGETKKVLIETPPDAGVDAGVTKKVIVDETLVLKPGEVQTWSLEPGTAHVSIYGVKQANKGFTVVARAGDRMEVTQAAKAKTPGGEKLKTLTRDVPVPSAPFTIAVANTENILERLTVHVRIVLDAPAEGGK